MILLQVHFFDSHLASLVRQSTAGLSLKAPPLRWAGQVCHEVFSLILVSIVIVIGKHFGSFYFRGWGNGESQFIIYPVRVTLNIYINLCYVEGIDLTVSVMYCIVGTPVMPINRRTVV